jgi:hypothetical protein
VQHEDETSSGDAVYQVRSSQERDLPRRMISYERGSQEVHTESKRGGSKDLSK